MDEAGFTRGPWQVVPYGDGDSLVIHDARGDWRVCFMATPSKDGDFEGILANANLIAAAPDLYSAAEELVRWYGPFNPTMHPPEINGAWLRLTAALARARGESALSLARSGRDGNE